ncbi:MAG: hypothetical protein ACKPB7_15120 [Sphaerospermopsis kisseleviana]
MLGKNFCLREQGIGSNILFFPVTNHQSPVPSHQSPITYLFTHAQLLGFLVHFAFC